MFIKLSLWCELTIILKQGCTPLHRSTLNCGSLWVEELHVIFFLLKFFVFLRISTMNTITLKKNWMKKREKRIKYNR